MRVEIKGNEIIITAPIEKRPSKSGKTILVATSGGNKPTTAQIDGKPVTVGFSAYIQ
jgi:hypothetical protein